MLLLRVFSRCRFSRPFAPGRRAAWLVKANNLRKGCLGLKHGREGWPGLSHGREGWLGLSHEREGWLGLSHGRNDQE